MLATFEVGTILTEMSIDFILADTSGKTLPSILRFLGSICLKVHIFAHITHGQRRNHFSNNNRFKKY